jgi:hypothetical protein
VAGKAIVSNRGYCYKGITDCFAESNFLLPSKLLVEQQLYKDEIPFRIIAFSLLFQAQSTLVEVLVTVA